ncbi:MAG: hypothetical protein KDK66_05090 [Deltaproteobacteria bacterium]|nr:hypothetical protein [Deltaproteobacteria bacterium]
MSTTFAVFDMGSNTLSVTGARLNAQRTLDFLYEGFAVTRLSENLKDGGRLDPQAKERLVTKLKFFLQEAKEKGIQQMLLVGTAAFRRAQDGKDFLKLLEARFQVPSRLLSGEEEAFYSFLAAQRAFKLEKPGVIDIGGGSTEIILGNLEQSKSLPIGTVSLSESLQVHDPIDDQVWQALGNRIHTILKDSTLEPKASPKQWIAVAATPTAIASCLQELPQFSIQKVHGFKITLKLLKNYLEKIRTLDLNTRQTLPGMDPNRAQLVPIGGKILEKTMEFFGVENITVSHHGLRQGILWEVLSS